jgi:uncharacterized protein YdiU (UPF0061 family)
MLSNLEFDNTFVRALPGDPEARNFRRQVPAACYSRVDPTPVTAPRVLASSREVAELVGVPDDELATAAFTAVFAGNRLLPGMEAYAACYGGHQFGAWAGQLGDGRAITLGEVVNARGERWELQLKGAGPTPYSRTADGRAVVRSSVREFLCSEAMHHLGVPTTRALSVIASGDEVIRDMFYDGRPRAEPGAVVCRVAPTFLRFGNFEIFAARGEHDVLRRLVDYAITTHFPALGAPSRETYVGWFDEICRRTVAMIAHWMRVGFVHGVMNTDNMSILGLTIDYGPYGWLEDYDPDWTPNTTDAAGRRYRYGHQPNIALWNLSRFGGALLPLVGATDELDAVLRAAGRRLEADLRDTFLRKLGLDAEADDGDGIVEELEGVLRLRETDMTIFFRKLADLPAGPETLRCTDEELETSLREAYYSAEPPAPDTRARTAAWLRRYLERVLASGGRDDVRRARMNALNPKYVLRNYLAQLAIDKAEQGDGSMVVELLDVLRRPYDEQPGREAYAAKRPEWARHRPGCSMLSCSS